MLPPALAGLKVLEFGDFIAGPYCAKLLADLGADVIKIEPPNGDRTRSYGPFPEDIPHPESSGLFLYLNTNKRGVTLNTDTATGKQIFLKLVAQADILVENNPPREMAARGFDYQQLKTVNPRLVMTSITPFGQTGPYRDYKGCDLTVFHASGMAYLTPVSGVDNAEQQPPLRLALYGGDYQAGVAAAIGTMSAILARAVTGKGQQVDLSQQEAIASHTRRDATILSYEGIYYIREKAKRPGGGGGGMWECRDGHITMGIHRDDQWPKAVEMMGYPDWTNSELFADAYSRRANHDALHLLCLEWSRELTVAEVSQAGQQRLLPCMPVNNIEQAVNSELYAAREFMVNVDRQETGPLQYPGAPYKLSGTPWHIDRPAPLLGEHNAEVYSNILGYARQDLVKMRQAGII